jgi:hypothetical protein
MNETRHRQPEQRVEVQVIRRDPRVHRPSRRGVARAQPWGEGLSRPIRPARTCYCRRCSRCPERRPVPRARGTCRSGSRSRPPPWAARAGPRRSRGTTRCTRRCAHPGDRPAHTRRWCQHPRRILPGRTWPRLRCRAEQAGSPSREPGPPRTGRVGRHGVTGGTGRGRDWCYEVHRAFCGSHLPRAVASRSGSRNGVTVAVASSSVRAFGRRERAASAA